MIGLNSSCHTKCILYVRTLLSCAGWYLLGWWNMICKRCSFADRLRHSQHFSFRDKNYSRTTYSSIFLRKPKHRAQAALNLYFPCLPSRQHVTTSCSVGLRNPRPSPPDLSLQAQPRTCISQYTHQQNSPIERADPRLKIRILYVEQWTTILTALTGNIEWSR